MAKRICETCGGTFSAQPSVPGRFCCRPCYLASRPKKAARVCEGCGVTFTPPPSSPRKRRFHSIACYRQNTGGNKHSQYQHDTTTVACKQCGDTIRLTSGSRDILFCDADCWRKYQKAHPTQGHGVCPKCGIGFLRMRKTQVCCSDTCQNAFYRLEKSPCWNGGEWVSQSGVIFVSARRRRGKGKFPEQPLYLLKHRMIVAEAIGRDLFPEEMIWHIDRNHSNNRLWNLYIFRSYSEMSRAIGRKQLPLKSNIIEAGTNPESEVK